MESAGTRGQLGSGERDAVTSNGTSQAANMLKEQ